MTRRVVEVVDRRPAPPPPPQKEEAEDEVEQVPLELLPAVRVLRGYGRRMRGLGTLDGVREAEAALAELLPIAGSHPGAAELLAGAARRLEALRATAMVAASGEREKEEE